MSRPRDDDGNNHQRLRNIINLLALLTTTITVAVVASSVGAATTNLTAECPQTTQLEPPPPLCRAAEDVIMSLELRHGDQCLDSPNQAAQPKPPSSLDPLRLLHSHLCKHQNAPQTLSPAPSASTKTLPKPYRPVHAMQSAPSDDVSPLRRRPLDAILRHHVKAMPMPPIAFRERIKRSVERRSQQDPHTQKTRRAFQTDSHDDNFETAKFSASSLMRHVAAGPGRLVNEPPHLRYRRRDLHKHPQAKAMQTPLPLAATKAPPLSTVSPSFSDSIEDDFIRQQQNLNPCRNTSLARSNMASNATHQDEAESRSDSVAAAAAAHDPVGTEPITCFFSQLAAMTAAAPEDDGGPQLLAFRCNAALATNPAHLELLVDIHLSDYTEEEQTAGLQRFTSALAALQENTTITTLSLHLNLLEWEDTLHAVTAEGPWHDITSLDIFGGTHTFDGTLRENAFSAFTALQNLVISIPNGAELSFHPQSLSPLRHTLVNLAVAESSLRPPLPNELLAGLSRLQKLDLALNRLTAIPTTLFHGLTALSYLYLDRNELTALPDTALHTLSALTRLHLEHNFLQHLHVGTFRDTQNLVFLNMEDNAITSLPTGLLAGLTRLFSLQAQLNKITALNVGLFDDLSRICELQLHENPLSSIHQDLFRGLSSLRTLALAHTNVRTLPPHLLRDLTGLIAFYAQDNHLTALPTELFATNKDIAVITVFQNRLTEVQLGLFAGLSKMDSLFLQNNQIQRIADGAFNDMTKLSILYLFLNKITTVTPNTFSGLGKLQVLDMHSNQVATLPHGLFSHMSSVTELYMNLNRNLAISISDLPPSSATLRSLSLSNIASFDLLSVPAEPHAAFPALAEFWIRGTEIRGDLKRFLLAQPQNSLSELTIGWPGLDESVLPQEILCNLLVARGATVRITFSGYKHLTTCPGKDVQALRLNFNERLESVSATTHDLLDVGHCPRLSRLSVAGSIDILDISATNLPYSSRFCFSLGRGALFGSAMTHPSFQERASRLLATCFRTGNVFDFSDNTWLADISLIEAAVPRHVILGEPLPIRDRFAGTLEEAMFRREVPFVILEGTAIECSVVFELRRLLQSGLTLPAFSYICNCASGHRRQGDVCVSTALSSSELAGIVIGVIATVCIVSGPFLLRWYRRKKREQYLLLQEKELQEHLLGEELEALKRGWQIDIGELSLIAKVDEGAFGEVWRATWDEVDVAVKFLKHASLGIVDRFMVEDVEKEVDFLRRTRHPHLVRFFGTGIDKHGAPFLVLEFVDLGSLKHLLLERGLEKVISEFNASDPNTALPSSRPPPTHGVHDHTTTSTWTLKLSFAHDVADGMAFLHSLNVMHRDLKSGNVLVTRRLVAKITDFGSMSGRLGKHMSSSQGQAGLDEGADRPLISQSAMHAHDATIVMGDQQYSPNTATRTVGATMTAGVGTPLYMAPEVLDGSQRRVTLKADVFSYGVLLWEICMCRVPDLIEQELGSDFHGFLMQSLLDLYRAGRLLAYPSSLEGDEEVATADPLPQWYRDLSLQCMALNPSERPTFDAVISLIATEHDQASSPTEKRSPSQQTIIEPGHASL